MRKIKQKLKHGATHAVVAVHKNSSKTRTACEAVSCIFVALETHFLMFSVILLIWMLIDLMDLIELMQKSRELPEREEPTYVPHRHRTKAKAANSFADRVPS